MDKGMSGMSGTYLRLRISKSAHSKTPMRPVENETSVSYRGSAARLPAPHKVRLLTKRRKKIAIAVHGEVILQSRIRFILNQLVRAQLLLCRCFLDGSFITQARGLLAANPSETVVCG